MALLKPHQDIATLARFARTLADAARRETLRWWEQGCTPENKAAEGAFDPVTEGDRAAELAMRRLIEEKFPDHGITGEEMADRVGRGRYRWSLDPIDGTRSFVCGMPTWVTLIALLDEELPVLGVIDVPRLDERYVGHGESATMIEGRRKRAISASQCRSLAEARLSSTDPLIFAEPEQPCFDRIRRAVRLIRYGHDGYAYGRLAAGTIDLVIESGLKPHDYNALIPIVRAAGGVIGDWHGGTDFSQGRVVAAATLSLYDEAIETLAFEEA